MNGAVSKVINSVLGSWIENINTEQLKLSVFSGEVSLENLVLKSSAIDSLGFPLTVVHGTVNKLRVKIPWTSLSSSPLKIEISGIHVLISPASVDTWSEEKEIQNVQNFKQSLLNHFEAISSSEISAIQEKGFTAKFMSKIVQNVQVSIDSFYIRYEDSISSIRPFCIGIVIKLLKAESCNFDWKPEYIEESIINHKLVKLDGIRVFLDFDEQMLIDHRDFGDFKSLVADEIEENQKHSYLLHPTNYRAKVIINTNSKNFQIPQYSVSLYNETVNMETETEQIVHVFKLLDYWKHFENFKNGIKHALISPALQGEDIEHYRTVYKRYKLSEDSEQESLAEFEKNFDVYSLINHRKLVNKELELLKKEQDLLEEIKKNETESKPGALSKITNIFWGKSDNQKKQDDENRLKRLETMKNQLKAVSVEKGSLANEMEDLSKNSADFDILPNDFVAYLVKFEVQSTSFTIKHESVELFSFDMKSFIVEVGLRPKSFYSKLSIVSTNIKENIIKSHNFPNLLEGDFLNIEYDTFMLSRISIKSGGIVLIVNMESFSHIFEVLTGTFSLIPANLSKNYFVQVSSKTAEYMEYGQVYMENIMKTGFQNSFNLEISLKAPLICVPLDIFNIDSGMLVMDLGNLDANTEEFTENQVEFEKYSFVFSKMRACVVWNCSDYHNWREGLKSEILIPTDFLWEVKNCKKAQFLIPNLQIALNFFPIKAFVKDEVFVFLVRLKEIILAFLPKRPVSENFPNKETQVQVTEAYKDKMKRIEFVISVKIIVKFHEFIVVLNEKNVDFAGILVKDLKIDAKLGNDGEFLGDFALGVFEILDYRENLSLNKIIFNPSLQNSYQNSENIFQIKANILLKPKSDMLDVGLYLNDMRIIAKASFFSKISDFFFIPFGVAKRLSTLSPVVPIKKFPVCQYTTTLNSRILIQLTNFELWLPLSLKTQSRRTGCFYFGAFIEYRSSQTYTSFFDKYNYEISREINLISDDASIEITNIGGLIGLINENRVVLSEERTNYLLPPSRLGIYYTCTKPQNQDIQMKINLNLESIQLEIGLRDLQYFKNLAENWSQFRKTPAESSGIQKINTKTSFQIDCDALKVTILEDTGVKAYALLRFHLSSLKSTGNLEIDKTQANFSTFMYSDYYNIKICAWEPLIENWNFEAFMIQESLQSPIELQIESLNMLDVNITMSMVDIIGTLMHKLGQNNPFFSGDLSNEKLLTDENELLAHGQFFYSIHNKLGSSIQVWLDLPKTEVDNWLLGPEQSQIFSYSQLQDRISMSSLKKGLSNGITEEVQAPIGICLKVDGFEIVKNLYFERIGVKGFLLKSEEKNFTVNCVLNVIGKENLRVIEIETGTVCMNNTNCPLVVLFASSEYELEIGNSWALPLKWLLHTEKPTFLSKGGQSPLLESKSIELITGDWAIQSLILYKTETLIHQTIIQFNPPFCFENLLPGLLTIYADKSDLPIGRINSGSPLFYSKLNPSSSHDFLFKLDLEGLYITTDWVALKGKKQNLSVKGSFSAKNISMTNSSLEFKKCKNLDLSLRKKVKGQDSDKIMSKTIEIYTPYCIVNKTSLEFELIDKKTFIFCPSHSVSFYKSDKLRLKIREKSFGVESETSKPFAVNAVGVSGCLVLPFAKKHIIEVPKEILVGMTVLSATAPLIKTKIVYITPRFMINNTLGYQVYIRQYFKDSPSSNIKKLKDSEYLEYSLEDSDINKLIQVSKDSKNWSSAFNIQNIEDFQIKFLGSPDDYDKNNEWHSPQKLNGFSHIIRVVVSTEDQATIHIVLAVPKDPEFLINNMTNENIKIKQHKFPELVVPGFTKLPWAFDDLFEEKSLELTINKKSKKINIEKVKKSKKFNKFLIEVRVTGVTRELRIINAKNSVSSDLEIEDNSKVLWKAKANFRGFGLSITDGKPNELFYFSAIDINCLVKMNEKRSSRRIENRGKFRLRIGKVQIDNMHDKNKLFPVIFGPSSKMTDESVPMIQIEVDKTSYKHATKQDSYENASIDRFSWVEVLIQEMKLNLNQETIGVLFELLQNIRNSLFISSKFRQFPAKSVPIREICNLIDTSDCRLNMSPVQAVTKTYFKIVRLCAIKILVSFKVSSKAFEMNIEPREGFGLLQLFGAIGGAFVNISDSPLYFKEIFINESFQTVPTLVWQIISNYQRQGILQFYKILGSSDLLGNPVGFIDKLGTGVIEFINEPVKGVIKGPKAFAEGVTKGMRSLVGNIVAGSFGSVSKITGNLYGLVKEIGGDTHGADQLNDSDNALENIYQGFKGSVIDLAKGVTGIFLKPWKGAKKGGAKGLLKGIGSGLLGIVTSPLSAALRIGTGISSGVTNAATFLAKGKVTQLGRTRFPRYFNPRKVLEPYNWEVAEAQDFLRHLLEYKKEQIVFYMRLEEEESIIIIVTLNYFLFIVNADLVQKYELSKINSLEVHMPHDNNFYIRIGSELEDALVISSQNYSPLIKLYAAVSSLTTPSKPQKGSKKIMAAGRYGNSCCKPKKKEKISSKYSLDARKT